MVRAANPHQRWLRVARASEIAPDTVRRVEVAGRAVALVNRAGEFFALDARCPHRGGPLDQGQLWRGALECPWHHFRFDPATGANLYPANVYPGDLLVLREELRPARTFPVKVVDGLIYVRLEPAGE